MRQDKQRPRHVCFFGEYRGPVCVYKDYLFTTYNFIHDITVTVLAKHAQTAQEYKYWFPCDAYEMPADREGEPLNCWDVPTKIYTSNDRVVIEVCRHRREIRKRATPIGEDVKYRIVGSLNGSPFGFQMVFPTWYLDEEKVDAMEAMKAFDFSDIKPYLC